MRSHSRGVPAGCGRRGSRSSSGGPRVAGTSRITYRDTNYAGRLGWREIVAGADAKSRSDELRAYPKDLLSSPLHVTSVATTVAPTNDPAPGLTRGRALEAPDRVADGGFASLIAHEKLGAGFVLLSLLIAMFWGAAHAFSPGHGKSIVAAYLVGSRGTPRHAVFLGLTVTVTHTIGVFALGLVTLSLSQFIVPDQLFPWLNLVSALLIVAVGVSVLRWRVREWRKKDAQPRPPPRPRAQPRSRRHHHTHDHALSARRLLGIGISGGIVPCPTALVVLLAAISLHRVGYGLVLILAFSLGLAGAMTTIGVIAVSAKRVFRRVDFDGGLDPPPPRDQRARRPRPRPGDDPARAPEGDLEMFGLDDWIAHLSGGATLLAVVGVAILLGLRHATDPDHLAAVTTLIASGRERTTRLAARLGLSWGMGHAASLFAFGLPIVLFKAYLPEAVQQGAETAVGFLIIGLAVWLLVRWRRGRLQIHPHPHVHTVRARGPLQAFGIGLVHGMGGSAGVGVLLLAAIHDRGVAVLALALFALCTAISMAALSTGFGLTLANATASRSFGRIAPALGGLSLLFGLWYALGALQLAPYFL